MVHMVEYFIARLICHAGGREFRSLSDKPLAHKGLAAFLLGSCDGI